MAIRFVQSATGHRIAYAVHGSGPPLVCTAWWVSHLERDWEDPHLRAFFSALAERHTVVRYDRAGVGLSDRDRTRFDLESERADLESLVDHLGFDRAAFLAISCGGAPALAYAARHPGRVSRLILYGSFVCGSDLGDSELRDALVALVRASWGLGANTLLELFDPDLPREDVHRMRRNHLDAAEPEMAARLLELTFAMDARDEAPRVTAPALVLHRRHDQTSPFEAGRNLAALVPNAKLVSLEGRAHVPWRGDSQAVIDEVLTFLGTGDASRAEATAEPDTNEIVRQGDVWRVTYARRRAHIKHRKGIADLAVLLAHPGAAVHALDLMEGTVGETRRRPSTDRVLDERAEQAYRQRIAELEHKLAAAEHDADLGRLEQLRAEREALLSELASAAGLGGRRRALNDPAERARKAVSARIRDGIAKVREVHPELGTHLESTVETGLVCRYAPESETVWVV